MSFSKYTSDDLHTCLQTTYNNRSVVPHHSWDKDQFLSVAFKALHNLVCPPLQSHAVYAIPTSKGLPRAPPLGRASASGSCSCHSLLRIAPRYHPLANSDSSLRCQRDPTCSRDPSMTDAQTEQISLLAVICSFIALSFLH